MESCICYTGRLRGNGKQSRRDEICCCEKYTLLVV